MDGMHVSSPGDEKAYHVRGLGDRRSGYVGRGNFLSYRLHVERHLKGMVQQDCCVVTDNRLTVARGDRGRVWAAQEGDLKLSLRDDPL